MRRLIGGLRVEAVRLVLALLASALVMFAVITGWAGMWRSDSLLPAERGLAASVQLKRGDGGIAADEISVRDYQGDRALVISDWGSIDGAAYPFVQFKVRGFVAGMQLSLLWRNLERPNSIHRLRMAPMAADAVVTLDLSKQKGWEGEILLMGFEVWDPLHRPLSLSTIDLYPPDNALRLRSILSEWSMSQPWSMRSINFLLGASDKGNAFFIPAVAAWMLGALLFYGLFSRLTRQRPSVMGVVVLLAIGWLLADLRWSLNHWFQSEGTYLTYAGKSTEEASQAAVDGSLYLLAKGLREKMEVDETTRVVMVAEDKHLRFWRRRLQYYLAPINIRNVDRSLSAAVLAEVDYLIVIGDITGLQYDDYHRMLEWGVPSRSLPAELITAAGMVKLYRLKSGDKPTRQAP